MTRVVMLTNAVAPDQLGGLERYVRELAAALVARGLAVTVAAKRTAPGQRPVEIGADGVEIRRHPVPSKRQPTFAVRYPFEVARGVGDALRAHPGALVHAHFAVPALPLALRRVPYVYTCHGMVHAELLGEHRGSYLLPAPVRRPVVAGLRTAERRVLRDARRVVTLSAATAGEVAALAPAAPTSVVPGGIDTVRFSPGPVGRDGWAAAADPLLVTARRLTASTGVAELVAGLPAVLAAYPGARLAVAGDGGLRPDVERQVAALGLGGAVRLLGRLDDAELVRWYRAADLAVVPSQTREGFGLATAEALACGTPVLVSPVGANPELVAGLPGPLVAADRTPAALAAAVCGLLRRPDQLAAVRSLAAEHARTRWSWAAVADAHLELYERELSRAPAAGSR